MQSKAKLTIGETVFEFSGNPGQLREDIKRTLRATLSEEFLKEHPNIINNLPNFEESKQDK